MFMMGTESLTARSEPTAAEEVSAAPLIALDAAAAPAVSAPSLEAPPAAATSPSQAATATATTSHTRPVTHSAERVRRIDARAIGLAVRVTRGARCRVRARGLSSCVRDHGRATPPRVRVPAAQVVVSPHYRRLIRVDTGRIVAAWLPCTNAQHRASLRRPN